MTKYYITFLRHGESEANLLNAFQGQKDTPLTSLGRSQAKSLAHFWQKENFHFDLIISSTLLRAKQTAEIIARILNVSISYDENWKERDTGQLTGVDRSHAPKNPHYKKFFTPFDKFGDTGEGDFDLFLRAGKALRNLLENPPGFYLVVSHGGILNQVLRTIAGVTPQSNAQGLNFRFRNTGYACFTYDPLTSIWSMKTFNNLQHLKTESLKIDFSD